MRSCPEKTKIHTYIDSQKARQLGAKRNKRQLSTLAKGCGKSAGPRAGRADGGPFAGGERTRRPPRLRPHRPFSLAASLRGRKCFSRLQVEKLRPREFRSPCWAVMEPWSLRALPFPRRRCSQTERIPLPPAPLLWSPQFRLLENDTDFRFLNVCTREQPDGSMS